VNKLECKADNVGIEILGINRMKLDVGQTGDGYQGENIEWEIVQPR
jgi:hypothetical protein